METLFNRRMFFQMVCKVLPFDTTQLVALLRCFPFVRSVTGRGFMTEPTIWEDDVTHQYSQIKDYRSILFSSTLYGQGNVLNKHPNASVFPYRQ